MLHTSTVLLSTESRAGGLNSRRNVLHVTISIPGQISGSHGGKYEIPVLEDVVAFSLEKTDRHFKCA
jgi:hypothetical protein